ncbi:MAG: hypothetical protein K6U80_19995 [Firmicutes bacterium]|nr:hypothetical protein [Bacillota bacterium]
MVKNLFSGFSDSSNVNLKIDFTQKQINMIVFDEKIQKYYQLNFVDCVQILIKYTDDIDNDLTNLTEGVNELDKENEHIRVFNIGFADETTVEIKCKAFSINPL